MLSRFKMPYRCCGNTHENKLTPHGSEQILGGARVRGKKHETGPKQTQRLAVVGKQLLDERQKQK